MGLKCKAGTTVMVNSEVPSMRHHHHQGIEIVLFLMRNISERKRNQLFQVNRMFLFSSVSI